MRILLISLYFHPDPAANSVIVSELARRLAAAGDRVTVICAMPHYDTNAIWPTYRGKILQHDQWQGVSVWRVWLYVPKRKTNLLGRFVNYVSFNVLSTLVGLFVTRPDVILAPSPPLTIGLTAWLLGLLRRTPYVYNVQDIYPDVAVRLGTLTSRRAILLFSAMERFVYRHAAAVSVISEGFRRNLLNKGVPDERIAVIPNFCDSDFVVPGPKDNAVARREGLADLYVVMFAGNVGLSQGLECVLEAAARLADEPELLVLIVGNGSAKPQLQAMANEMKLDNVRFLPYLPREEVPDLYAAADLCLIPLRRGIAQESVPSKALTIMSAARPMIVSVDAGSDIADLVEASGCGICLPPEDPVAMAEAIRRLRKSPGLCQCMGSKGRATVCQQYTPEIVAQQYADLLRGLVG